MFTTLNCSCIIKKRSYPREIFQFMSFKKGKGKKELNFLNTVNCIH